MRPVDKGESPYNTIKKYQDALPYLGEKIGYYCSYCEFPIKHVPESLLQQKERVHLQVSIPYHSMRPSI